MRDIMLKCSIFKIKFPWGKNLWWVKMSFEDNSGKKYIFWKGIQTFSSTKIKKKVFNGFKK